MGGLSPKGDAVASLVLKVGNVLTSWRLRKQYLVLGGGLQK